MSVARQQDEFRIKAENIVAQQGEPDITSLVEARSLLRELQIRATELELKLAAATSEMQSQTAALLPPAENSEIVLYIDPQGVITDVFSSTHTVLGYHPDELIGTQAMALVHPDDLERKQQWYAPPNTPPSSTLQDRVRFQRRDGTYAWLATETTLVISDTYSDVTQYIVNARDITKRHQQEIARAIMAKRVEMATTASGIGIWEWAIADDNAVHWDEHMCAIYGIEKDAFDGRIETIMDFTHPDDREQFASRLVDITNSAEPISGVYRIIRADGAVRTVESSGVMMFDDDEQPLRAVGTVKDITGQNQVLAALAEERNLLRTLVDAIPDSIYVVDVDRRLILVNHGALAYFGAASDEDVLEKTPADIAAVHSMTPSHGAMLEVLIEEVFADGAARIDVEEYRVRNDGQEQWMLHTCVPLRDSLDSVVGVIGNVRNISALKRSEKALRDNEHRLKLATQIGRIGIWDVDLATETVTFDDAMCELYGLPRTELSGHVSEWIQRIHPDDRTLTLSTVESAIENPGTVSFTFRVVNPDGTVRYLQGSAGRIQDVNGHAKRLIGVNIDITEQMQTRAALEETLMQEKELGELKSRFVSMASHEFRTPLAGILTVTESLSRYRGQMSEAQIEERLSKIRARVKFMSDMLEDVLVLARMEAGYIEIQPKELDFAVVCKEVVRDTCTRFDAVGRIDLQTEAPVIATADERLIRQVFDNLIANALHYSPADSRVAVELVQTDTGIRFTVQDSGIGIPPQDLGRLFNPFHRGKNVGTRTGTGLGLGIVKHAIDLHGGDIEIKSVEEQGTTIIVTIPNQGSDRPQVGPAPDHDS